MSEPRSIRFEARTLSRLSAYAARRPGVTSASAAARLVEEGLRMDAHPGIVFRDGPAGRRAVLIGGPDVWEVIGAIRGTRSVEPELSDAELLALVEANSGVRVPLARVALDYYGEYPEEITEMLDQAETATRDLEAALERTSELLRA